MPGGLVQKDEHGFANRPARNALGGDAEIIEPAADPSCFQQTELAEAVHRPGVAAQGFGHVERNFGVRNPLHGKALRKPRYGSEQYEIGLEHEIREVLTDDGSRIGQAGRTPAEEHRQDQDAKDVPAKRLIASNRRHGSPL